MRTSENSLDITQLAANLGHGRPANEIVADAIRHLIAAGKLLPGHRLPPEREFAPALGAARVTIRAAIRQLNKEGVVRTERGRNGGTVVLDRARIASTSKSIAHFRSAIESSFEFRRIIEPTAAGLAAERGSAKDKGALLALSQQHSKSQSSYNELDARFHLLVAKMTQNRHIGSAIELNRNSFFVLANSLFLRIDVSTFPDFAEEHCRVAAAINAGNSRLASKEMAAHIRRSHLQFLRVLSEG